MSEQSATPVVSVIMSMRDSAATIEAAVRSVIWQTHTDWELILIDDGSRDDSVARAMMFGDPRIRIIRHDISRGLATRLNEAVDLARGDYIARMDADDICYPERLAEQLAMLQADPAVDVVASAALMFRRSGEIVGVLPAATTHEAIVARPYRGFPFAHPTWCGRAAWFRRNRYDPTVLVAQDSELLLRAYALSRFAASDRVLLGYRKESVRLARSLDGRLMYARSVWRHAAMSGKRAQAVEEIALHFARFGLEASVVALGVEKWWLKRRFRASLRPEDVRHWRDIWSAMKKPQKHPGPGEQPG